MKIKRLKSYRKTLDVYSKHFELQTDPLEIFVDSTFARQALIHQLHIKEQFKNTLNCNFMLVTSTCILLECEKLGVLFAGTLKVLQDYKILKCSHSTKSVNGGVDCIKKRICAAKSTKNKAKLAKRNLLFGLATNDDSLKQYARSVAGMPIFFIAHKRINMEPISDDILQWINQKALIAPLLSSTESASVQAIKTKFGYSLSPNIKYTKKPKGPNPLSCKRKIKKQQHLQLKQKNKRKRNRIKLTWAMKQAIESLKLDMGVGVK